MDSAGQGRVNEGSGGRRERKSRKEGRRRNGTRLNRGKAERRKNGADGNEVGELEMQGKGNGGVGRLRGGKTERRKPERGRDGADAKQRGYDTERARN